MRLVGSEGTDLQIRIGGYQFPAMMSDQYDSDWLLVEVEAACERGRWAATDPCLLVGEAQRLRDWFRQIAQDCASVAELEFTEPSLRFCLQKADEDELQLRVYFELEVRPPWAASDCVNQPDCWIDLTVDRSQLRAACESLTKQLRQFPRRGNA